MSENEESIQIDIVRINGFRGISNLELSLPRVTVLIGQNNSGKTSVIKALQLALGDYSRFLSDEDFHIDEHEKRSEVINVDIRFIPTQDGVRSNEFSQDWQVSFGDKIASEADGKQFVAVRTTAQVDRIKGGFLVDRFHMKTWPDHTGWQDVRVPKSQKLNRRLEAIPFISIDAQRDIHNELRDRTSFIGRVLSSVEYDERVVAELERMVAEVNREAVENSEPLQKLKTHLDNLNESFEGSGSAELTPFPKKIRDLSKRFSVHFGETNKNSFSMEYHGMGTRSWASMLTVKAFADLLAKNHEEEEEPYFPVIAAEEPEAHLHPNAQRTVFEQLQQSPGQIVISTHSPYLAGISDLTDLRGLVKKADQIESAKLIGGLDSEDLAILRREVMRFRGELLFSKALILFEGVTEEQIVPAMFQNYFETSSFTRGVSCISVAGKNYAPYVKMALSFGIPVAIVSDNDGNTKTEVEAQIQKIRTNTNLELSNDNFFISFLSGGNDFEAELVNTLNLRDEVIESLVKSETRGSDNEHWVRAKTAEITSKTDGELVELLRDSKASYSGYFAEVVVRNPQNRLKESLLPSAVKDAFEKIAEWIR